MIVIIIVTAIIIIIDLVDHIVEDGGDSKDRDLREAHPKDPIKPGDWFIIIINMYIIITIIIIVTIMMIIFTP